MGLALSELRAAFAGDRIKAQALPVRVIDSGGEEQLSGVEQDELRALISADFAGAALPMRTGGLNRVFVENGVGTPGLGTQVRNELVAAGFDFKGAANVPGFPYKDRPSAVLIFSSEKAAQDAGHAVAKAIDLPPTAVQLSNQPQTRADVIVVLGEDYQG